MSKQEGKMNTNTMCEQAQIIDRFMIVTMTDKNGVILDASQGFLDLSGYSKDEIIGSTHQIMKHPDNPNDIYDNLWETICKGEPWEGEIKNLTKDGGSYWSKVHIEPVKENDEIVAYIAIRNNITEKKDLMTQAMTDKLTGLYNRTKLEHILSRQSEYASRYDTPFSVLFMDIDHFKSINDRYGHTIGDNILVQFADTVKNVLRKGDYFGRWGGEEFIIVAPYTKADEAFILAEKIRLVVETQDLPIPQKLSVSIGISEFSLSISIDNLIDKADRAMYEAKKKGRNQTICFDCNGMK